MQIVVFSRHGWSSIVSYISYFVLHPLFFRCSWWLTSPNLRTADGSVRKYTFLKTRSKKGFAIFFFIRPSKVIFFEILFPHILIFWGKLIVCNDEYGTQVSLILTGQVFYKGNTTVVWVSLFYKCLRIMVSYHQIPM